MNFLPCNIPIVMTLVTAISGAESRGAFLKVALHGMHRFAHMAVLKLDDPIELRGDAAYRAETNRRDNHVITRAENMFI